MRSTGPRGENDASSDEVVSFANPAGAACRPPSPFPLVSRRRQSLQPGIFPSPSSFPFDDEAHHFWRRDFATSPSLASHQIDGSPNAGTSGFQSQAPQFHNAQIVLYKDRSIVAWDETRKQLRLKELSPRSTQVLNSHRIPHCPMCGQVVDLESFSFVANAYFQVLEDAMKAYRAKERHARRWSPRHRPSEPHQREATRSLATIGLGQRQRSHSDLIRSGPLTRTQSQPDPNPFVSSDQTSFHDLSASLLINGYYSHFFVEEKKLGSGAFGQVYLCRHMLDDLFVGYYAVKKIPVGDSRAWLKKMLREVRIREHLHHQNIVGYKHSWLEMHQSSPFCPAIPWLYVLMDYCDEGDLEGLIGNQISRDRALTDLQVWALFLDILEGLSHLHRAGILHRDLKPQNILLKSVVEVSTHGVPERETRALLADFGTSELLCEEASRTGDGFTGTVEYTAPELLQQDAVGRYSEPYDFASDMWSLGMVLHYLAFQYVPFDGLPPAEARDEILKLVAPIRLPIATAAPTKTVPRSREIVDLISALLSPEPNIRPSCEELTHHPVIKMLRESTAQLLEARCTLTTLFVPNQSEAPSQ